MKELEMRVPGFVLTVTRWGCDKNLIVTFMRTTATTEKEPLKLPMPGGRGRGDIEIVSCTLDPLLFLCPLTGHR